MKAESSAPKRAYHHGNLPEALIEASLQVIREQGVKGLTLREIGKRLQVSRMAAYRHFAHKEDLLASISKRGFERFACALEMARDRAGSDFACRMDAMAAAYVQFAKEHHEYFEVMFGEGGEPRYLDEAAGTEAQRAFQVLEGEIQHGQASGEVGPGDSEVLARLVWALVHGISTLNFYEDAPFTAFCSQAIRRALL